MDLGVDLKGLHLVHPVMSASGCLGLGREGTGLVDARRLGAIVTRTLTFEPSTGAAPATDHGDASSTAWRNW